MGNITTHDDGTEVVRELCQKAGLTYHGTTVRENRAVVIATDAEGIREYYTFPALYLMADATRPAGEEEPKHKSGQFPPGSSLAAGAE
jgi:hypothetical protein